MTLFNKEFEFVKQGYTVCGVDEVGRGCLAGPLVLSASVFTENNLDDMTYLEQCDIRDSKKLSDKRRRALMQVIKDRSLDFKLSEISVEAINTYGIMGAWNQGFIEIQRKIEKTHGNTKKILFLIDGNEVKGIIPNKYSEIRWIVRGDSLYPSIGLASIFAKVKRDDHMIKLSKKYSDYGWERNKGYGTKEHIEALQKVGQTDQHRLQFIRSFL